MGIGIVSIHFLNDRYLKWVENKGKKGEIQADIEHFFKDNHSFFIFVFVLGAKSLPFSLFSLKYLRFEV